MVSNLLKCLSIELYNSIRKNLRETPRIILSMHRVKGFKVIYSIVGCNLPWLEGKMGWDIAYHQKWGYGFDFTSAEDAFFDLNKMGVKVVRWWVFTDCRAGYSL